MKRLTLVALLLLLGACDRTDVPTGTRLSTPGSSARTSDPNDDFHWALDKPEEGSHFRLGHIAWRRTGTNRAEFSYTAGFRRSAFGALTVGQTIALAVLNFGDGTSANPPFTVTFVDPINDWFEARAVVSHTYPGPGPYTARSDGCCRIGIASTPGWAHMNNADQPASYWTLVNFAAQGSAVSTLPAMVTCAINGLCTFFVTAALPSDQTVSYRLATPAEMGGPALVNPSGASVNAGTGLYSWNTTGAPVFGPGRISVYSTAVVMEGRSATGQLLSMSMMDFLIRLADVAVNAPPAFQAPTPADGHAYTVYPGQPLQIDVSAADADAGDVVTITALGLPSGAAFSTTPGNPANGTMSFTPTLVHAGQNFVVSFVPSDNHGLNGSQRSFSIRVPANSPPVARITGPSSTIEGTTVVLDAGSSTDADGDVLSYEWTVNGTAAGTGQTLSYDAVDGPANVTIGLTARDASTSGATTAILAIQNAPPVVSAGANQTIIAGQTAVFSGSFTDAGVNDHPWSWSWSTGQSGLVGTQASSLAGGAKYCSAGTFTETLSVTDKDGGVGTSSLVVTVNRLGGTMDIKPEVINLRENGNNGREGQHGLLSAHVYSTADFDATKLNPASILISDGNGPGVHVAMRNNSTYYFQTDADLNGDGRPDALIHFSRDALYASGGLSAASTRLIILGELTTCQQVRIVDSSVTVIP